MSESTDVNFRMRIENDDDLLAVRDAARRHGVAINEVTRPPSGGLEEQVEPITAVLVGTGVVVGVKMIMDWWERRKGGLVIDLRANVPDMLYRERDLPYGFIVTFPADGGKVTTEVKDLPDAAEKWVSEVISGASKSFTQVAEAAKALVGTGRVEVVPATAAG